ncbi:MAG: tetratricopeptide repeat protein [Alphaproteobacteria bacterium]|nr:tetratricopeptide repeat protein [Alphaproteobacteria bacterium]MBU1514478.1 tetratricopeptide repeat protein [Alphaproteobacteria bacterium]MBU2096890.1 tetratricopeptide repeat protein [Alphaproteobacteria bacterium]MBU2153517.1 tetratricopeptide repeat protein [Alphaproteobacteria bacterium]MBU2305978.1 tetratricopeptide repeat protein [Alphaproteobacteria bacterium]
MSEFPSPDTGQPSLAQARDLQRAGRFEACEAVLDALIGGQERGFDLFHLKGLMAAVRGDNPVADHWLAQALDIDAGHVEVLRLHGMVLRRLGRAEAALDRYAAMLAVDPSHAEGHLNRANVLNDLQRWPEALESAERALALRSGFAGAANARGIALLGLGRAGEATASFQAAIRLDPSYGDAQVNLGNAIAASGKAAEALEIYDRAIAINPRLVAAWNGRGNVLAALQRWAEAVAAYDEAMVIQPTYPGLLGQRLYARTKLCDWRGYDEARSEVLDSVRAGRLASTPFALLALSERAEDERTCAETYVSQFLGGARAIAPSPAPGQRLRIGYFSADLYNHATAQLMAEVFEQHDRSAFEVTAFSFGRQAEDDMRRRLVPAFERFFDVAGMDDRSIAEMSRGLGIDIAVDLKGFTLDARTGIFLRQAAPLQVNYLGYPGTMGAPFMDYLIADPILIPPDARGGYAEKIAYLPGCYQPNDGQRPLPPPATARADHGLPAEGFVFGCFNSTYKITPQVFAIWMRLLRQVEGSVLWLFRDDPLAAENLRREAAGHGVEPSRLVFAELRPKAAHLERLRHMDLFLDTSPYNAHTTGSDALWMATPMVTMPGATFAARVGASLVTAVDAPELVAGSWAEYEALALALARDPDRLGSLRARLAAGRLEKRLFDTPRFTRDLEALYRAMQARRVAGLAPDHITLDA